MTVTLNKNPNASLSRALRLLLYLVLIGIAIYQFSQKENQAPVKKPSPEPPGIHYVPSTEQAEKPVAEKTKPAANSETKVVDKAENKSTPRGKIRTQIEKQTIRDESGNVVYTGTIDLSETIARIQRGEELTQFRNDGTVFQNRERRLPPHGSGYYREWVHPTPDERGPGPQRVITGENGEFWYTPNHYKSFIKLN